MALSYSMADWQRWCRVVDPAHTLMSHRAPIPGAAAHAAEAAAAEEDAAHGQPGLGLGVGSGSQAPAGRSQAADARPACPCVGPNDPSGSGLGPRGGDAGDLGAAPGPSRRVSRKLPGAEAAAAKDCAAPGPSGLGPETDSGFQGSADRSQAAGARPAHPCVNPSEPSGSGLGSQDGDAEELGAAPGTPRGGSGAQPEVAAKRRRSRLVVEDEEEEEEMNEEAHAAARRKGKRRCYG